MKVSIIIPFYNCPYVDQAVKSALNQTYPNIEVIVVNDGSTKHKEKLAPFLDKIKYIEKANGGTATALNAGIDAATGNYFSWLSSDDQFLPDKTAEQLAFMQNSKAQVSYTAFRHIDPNSIVTGEIRYKSLNWRKTINTLAARCPINGCTVMADMNLIRQAGKFDESLKYTHDYDMWCKLSLRVHMVYFDKFTVHYRVHDEMGTKKHFPKLEQEANEVRMRYKKAFLEFNESKRAAANVGTIPLRKMRKPLK
ncbi:glycosyltransferase [Rossellomorea vietnamensis]|uniref:Glycosyltransferase n=1 Tax=Rossellomorea vietnamensis TaxID=218284 RepID=A0A5D4MA99_9BACI|nr:glycosyltransferase [Rossellomorea vietnamensis]TYR98884.1 glycosyltransferase [Rossellomorea vietnamensis]